MNVIPHIILASEPDCKVQSVLEEDGRIPCTLSL